MSKRRRDREANWCTFRRARINYRVEIGIAASARLQERSSYTLAMENPQRIFRRRHLRLFSVAVASALMMLSGCALWRPGYDLPLPEPSGGTVRDADVLFDQADQRDAVERALREYEAALGRAATNRRHVLNRISELHLLLGAAYTDASSRKRDRYRTAIAYSERALVENGAFRRAIANGALSDAVQHLGEEDLKSMLLWVTSVSYLFKEGLGPLRRIIHFRTLAQTQVVLDRMAEMDAAFEYGSVPFSQAIFHVAVPSAAGGDITLAPGLFEEAIAVSEGSLLIRWGRAKYYYEYIGNREGQRRDLRWLVAQDPRVAPSPYPWNVYFQRDAADLLSKLESSSQ